MAISTETENLINFYNQKISLDNAQISQINTVENGYTIKTGIGSTEQIIIWGPNDLISNYDVPIEKLDTRIVEINNEIAELQNDIAVWGETANSVGCGTTGWSIGFTTTIVYEDQVRYKGYSYSGQNPFEAIDGILTIVNSGIGTQSYIQQVAIGSYFSPIGTCYNLFTCTTQICAGYATSISNAQSQISTLQSERNGLISKVNILKNGRSGFELQQYAYTRSKERLNQQIQDTQSIITFLTDPANDEWL